MILITGGTGLVGSHLLYLLSKRPEPIRAIKRHTSDLQKVKRVFEYYEGTSEAERLFSRIEWVDADILDIPALEEAFEGVEKVYHSAALISFSPSDEKKLRKVNIEGTANIVNLCLSHGVQKLCYASSVAALGKTPNNSLIDESTQWNPELDHSDYAISKYGSEIEVWRGTQEGLKAVIVNPGIIIGPGFWNSGSGKIFSRIDRGLKFHFPKVSGFVGVEDVAESMIRLMESNINNEKFVLVSENLSFRKVFNMVAEDLGKPAPSIALKKWMVYSGWVLQKIASWFGFRRLIARDSIDGLFTPTCYNNEKIQKTIDFSFTPMREVFATTSEKFLMDKKEINSG